MQDPNTAREWVAVAKARQQDGIHLENGSYLIAAVHLFGFAAECYAKSLYLSKVGKASDRIHDIIELLRPAGYLRKDLSVQLRAAAECHDPSLRYQVGWPNGYSDETVDEMKVLVEWIGKRAVRATKLKRARGRRR